MRRTVIFAGEAGSGVDRTAQIFGRILAEHGSFCFIYRDYASLIRGGHNFSVVTFNDVPVGSHDEKADVLVALSKEATVIHKSNVRKGGITITAGDYGDDDAIIAPGGSGRHLANNSALGMLARIFGLDEKKAKKIFQEELKITSGPAETAYVAGYSMFGELYPIKKQKSETKLMDGGEAFAKAATDMGVGAAFYYPMTPATGVFIRLEGSERKVNVIRMEDEIAAANAALGASFAGVRAMTGSSGGGLALMGEAISLSGMAELPLVIYAAQRLGPSTGVPTYTAQGDLRFILGLGSGEFPKAVSVPGDAEESYSMGCEAFYLADKYRIPVFSVTDKHIAESYFSVPKKMISTITKARCIKTSPSKGYRNYEDNDEGYSPMALLGNGNILRATSYEHDEDGFTVEDPERIVLMNDKRKRKMTSLAEEISGLDPISVFGKGSKVIISAGSTKGSIIDALGELKGWKFIQIKYIEPFPRKELLKAVKGASEIVTVENNATGLLAGIIREHTCLSINREILKYDGRPFTSDDVVKAVTKKSRTK